jgi:hypothetical protein
MVMRAYGEDTPSEPETSEEVEEEGEVTSPPHSLLLEALPSFGDIYHMQMGGHRQGRLHS